MSSGHRSATNRLLVFGQHDAATIAQLREVAQHAEAAALMADGHVGYVMPIAGLPPTRTKSRWWGSGSTSPAATRPSGPDLTIDDFGDTPQERRARLSSAADAIQATVSFGIGHRNRADDAPVDHELFESDAWEAVPARHRSALREKARAQLGTVGGGNHYVDVFADEGGRIWVGVHFGSRGFGYTVASGFLALGQNRPWGERVPEREVRLRLEDDARVGRARGRHPSRGAPTRARTSTGGCPTSSPRSGARWRSCTRCAR